MAKIFSYQGRDVKGALMEGKLASEDLTNVVTYLASKGITPISIEEERSGGFSLKSLATKELIPSRVKPIHIMNICRQLATLYNVGIPIVKALERLAASTDLLVLKNILQDLAQNIAGGMTFSEALKRHPKIFSEIMVGMVEVGEGAGSLGDTLLQLSKYIESSINNHKRFISAIRYPLCILVTIFLAVIIMSIFVIPKFTTIFAKYNLDLPLATRIILKTSEFLLNNTKILVIVMLLLIMGVRYLFHFPEICAWWDEYKLRIPVFGRLQRQLLIAQFAWTFSLILKANVPITQAVGLVSNAMGNRYFKKQLDLVKVAVEHGESFSLAVTNSGLFDPLVLQMIEIGEESQTLDETLAGLASHYTIEIDYSLASLNQLLEPMILLILGGMIFVLALGIYFPMWDMIQAAHF